MLLRRLWLADFRSYAAADVELAPGLSVVLGANGQGKTNLLEAIGYLATLGSFRGAPTEALIRSGAARAVVRAECERDRRQLLIEAEIATGGKSRVQVNRQRLRRSRDLLGALRTTVFSPDDLSLLKGGPAHRRRYLDELLVALNSRYDTLMADVERVLRQRNALLKQCAGGSRFDEAARRTLEVWDAKMTESGEALARARSELVRKLEPELRSSYTALAPDRGTDVRIAYEAPWLAAGLAAALESSRPEELRRGLTLVGPHRDDLDIQLNDLPARTHASQGEHRSLALAMRLAGHAVVTAAVSSAPVLLLDDVFSELDAERSSALLEQLPPGQTVLSSAVGIPPGAEPDLVLRVESSKLVERS